MTPSRLYIVSGKGGVGRSTTAVALALALGTAGKRTVLVEMSGNSQVKKIFGWEERSYTPRSIGLNVEAQSLTPTECFDDFVAVAGEVVVTLVIGHNDDDIGFILGDSRCCQSQQSKRTGSFA